MSNHKYSRQLPEVGGVAKRLLTIPVMAFALLVCYLLLRSVQDEPALMADAAPAFAVAPDQATAMPAALRTAPMAQQAAAGDPAAATHDALDAIGAGRSPAP